MSEKVKNSRILCYLEMQQNVKGKERNLLFASDCSDFLKDNQTLKEGC